MLENQRTYTLCMNENETQEREDCTSTVGDKNTSLLLFLTTALELLAKIGFHVSRASVSTLAVMTDSAKCTSTVTPVHALTPHTVI